MQRNSLKIAFLSIFLLTSGVLAQTNETPCTQETIAACYEQARNFYLNHEYDTAKALFEKIISLDAGYKQSTRYLKKCQKNLTKIEQRKAKEQPDEPPQAPEAPVAANEATVTQDEYPPAVETAEEATETKGKTAGYHIGVGDVLEISVWRNPELEKNVIVRPDGLISYPLVGDMPAAGLTLTELDAQLTNALKDYVRAPEVSIAVQRFGGTKVIILGEVTGPGVYSLPGGGNVLDAIALAGGFKNESVKKGTLLIRGGLAHPEVYRLNMARIFKGDLSQNIPIAANDIIYVPTKFLVNIGRAVNQVTPILSNMLLGTSVYRDLKDLSK